MMSSLLQSHTAYPLFVLYRAIKHRTESGPVDVFTGRSRYSLNFAKMLEEDIEFKTLVSFRVKFSCILWNIKIRKHNQLVANACYSTFTFSLWSNLNLVSGIFTQICVHAFYLSNKQITQNSNCTFYEEKHYEVNSFLKLLIWYLLRISSCPLMKKEMSSRKSRC